MADSPRGQAVHHIRQANRGAARHRMRRCLRLPEAAGCIGSNGPACPIRMA
ncbi:hypothetical protein [Azotobacter chroococcum]|jgi:hypothetical protein|uniref:hypothetical protein n=1 Tax=Azotobacter chroococcum TaxID=353 RepID=UPI000A63BED7|nr:hypothetical protein [Azotobacter chroococcum]